MLPKLTNCFMGITEKITRNGYKTRLDAVKMEAKGIAAVSLLSSEES